MLRSNQVIAEQATFLCIKFAVIFSLINFFSLVKVPACTGPTLCTNLRRGRTWVAGGITDVIGQCLNCLSTCDSRLTGLTLEKLVRVNSCRVNTYLRLI